ncbi:hypothetical protein [Jiangella endophytica]|uniref:hypothetical protein n=1 Tax=Jiangella endophytica TaxID=1623398 RepID=UPI000E34ACC8|nr:hypothetical protein [Jiangella endophytica]
MSWRRSRTPSTAPVVLPRLTVTPDDDGFTLTLDGEPVAGSPVSRAELGQRIAATIDVAGGPVRVDVTDPGGGVHSDIIDPSPHGPDPRPSRTDQAAFAVHHRGFLPGEQVVIAVVERTETANDNGVVTLSTTRELAGGMELLLFGRVSGTTFVVGPR